VKRWLLLCWGLGLVGLTDGVLELIYEPGNLALALIVGGAGLLLSLIPCVLLVLAHLARQKHRSARQGKRDAQQ
jgi:hypothetical protein